MLLLLLLLALRVSAALGAFAVMVVAPHVALVDILPE
jgi:hypothetical protein